MYKVYFTRVCATPGLDSVTIRPDHLPCGILLLIRVASKSVSGLGEYYVSIQFPCHKEGMSMCARAVILHASSAKSLLKAWENL